MNALEFLDRQGVDFEVKHHEGCLSNCAIEWRGACTPSPFSVYAGFSSGVSSTANHCTYFCTARPHSLQS